MKFRKSLALLLSFIFIFPSFTLLPLTAQAKSGATTKKAVYLKENKTYRQYDVTGDGKADRIKVKCSSYYYSESGNGETAIYVNGKKRKKFSDGAAVDLYLVAMTKKLSYIIAISQYKGGDASAAAYRYVNGRFKKANAGELGKVLTFERIKKNTKNELYVEITTGRYEQDIFEDEAFQPFTAVYKVKNKKLVLKSNVMKAKSNSYTANDNFYLSSNPYSNDYNGPFVSYGDKVKILSLRVVKKEGYYTPSYKISVNGKKGWLTPEHKSYDGTPFLR